VDDMSQVKWETRGRWNSNEKPKIRTKTKADFHIATSCGEALLDPSSYPTLVGERLHEGNCGGMKPHSLNPPLESNKVPYLRST